MGIENPFFRPHDGLAAGTSVIDGRDYDNFASYNYLGLNGHPQINAAAKAFVDQYGTSVSASRIVAGERPFHAELEAALARIHGVESSIVMVSGHATNVTSIGHLMHKGDLVLTDAFVHNSIAEGVRLSGATRMNFPHDDLDALEKMLADHRHKFDKVLIVVEGLYSMDGDFPDLKRIVKLKQSYDAWLMVDEAHSIGVLGKTGEVEIWMGTLSKTFSSCGGYIAGSKVLCDYLKVSAPGFVFSVGLSAALAGAAIASAELLEKEPERVQRLQENGALFLKLAKAAGLNTDERAGYADRRHRSDFRRCRQCVSQPLLAKGEKNHAELYVTYNIYIYIYTHVVYHNILIITYLPVIYIYHIYIPIYIYIYIYIIYIAIYIY
ncbi:UNVERIFIED_CONTAM: hypothetical protein GTU68_021197 [Idotea baltica]|nr:hypothetical protein [Idotea baltica]